MRRLAGLGLLLVILSAGCGSTSNDDNMVMQFISFDNTGLTQEDAVGETSADVDVPSPGLCLMGMTLSVEPFTQTVINAVFRNNEKADIQLTGYMIDVGSTSGLAPISLSLTRTLPGGHCSNVDQSCATDADCLAVAGACQHTETTVADILLFDFGAKEHVIPGTYSVEITFFGSDPNHSYETRTNYVVRFDNFCNCPSGSTCVS